MGSDDDVQAEPNRLTLQIDSADPIGGHLLGPDGVGHRFTGWIELASVIAAQLHERDTSRTGRGAG